MEFKILSFNEIQNHIFQWYSKSYLSMKFKILSFNEIQNLIFQWNSKSYLSIKFKIISFNKILIRFYRAALHEAVIKGNIEIIKLLFEQPNINMGIKDEIFIIIK